MDGWTGRQDKARQGKRRGSAEERGPETKLACSCIGRQTKTGKNKKREGGRRERKESEEELNSLEDSSQGDVEAAPAAMIGSRRHHKTKMERGQ